MQAGFESLAARTEGRTSLHCKNVFERLQGGSDAFWVDHHGWRVVGFQIWSVHKVSVNAVEEKRQTMEQKSSHGTVPAEIDVNFIFQRPRRGDGGMGAMSEKCRLYFAYRKALEIEKFYLQDEAGVVGGEPVCAPSR